MNASKFMDKQIMDLSRSKSDLNNNNNSNDFLDLMNPQSEEETNGGSSLKKNEEILPSFDFQPIHRPVVALPSLSSPDATASSRAWTSLDSKPNSSPPLRSCSSMDHVEPDKVILEKAQKVNDSTIISEVDRTMKKYTDSLLHAIDSLSARLSQLETRTRHLEYSMDDLKVCIGNNHGSVDGKMRQLENVLLEVQAGVQDIKDKQEVMDGHMQLAKLQIKVDQSSETPNATHPIPDPPVQQEAAAAASASAPPHQSNLQHFPTAVPPPQSLPSLSPNNPLPPQQNIHPPPPPSTPQFPPSQLAPGPHRDAYFPPPGQTQEIPTQHYQMSPPVQQPPNPVPQPPPQYQPAPTPPYPQPPHQHHPSVGGANASPQFQLPLGHPPEESPYVPAQTYPPSNPRQPTSQAQPYYGSPSPMYERSSSGFSSVYVPPSGPSESSYPSYGGPPSHYGGASSIKPQPQPHSPRGGGGSYPQIPTARLLPQSIPTATPTSGGSSSSGGSGNRVPIDDVIDKVTNMGFPREHVRATVRRLTENGQAVDLNIVLDKLMNDGEVQPPRGWFGR